MAITKIKAKNDEPKPKITSKTKVKAKAKNAKPSKPKKGIVKILFIVGNYFKGAWQELKEVRWPDRKSAWALTGAVIAFTGFFIGLIILLDYLFEMLFKLIIK